MKNFVKGKIEKIEILSKYYLKLKVLLPYKKFSFQPGQFVMLSDKNSDITFSRPFSVLNWEGNYIEILIKMVGKFTKKISKIRENEEINILGPLGNSFKKEERVALVAGGYGIAPLYFYLKKGNNLKNIYIFYGGKTEKDILLLEALKKLLKKENLFVGTEDGSLGEKGLITDIFQKNLNKIKIEKVYGCGPLPMFKALKEICNREKLDLYVSMDPIMACGYGVCLGCVIPTKNGNICACTEGPIFNSKEILWDKL
ncbi:MAG: dihydroorotate dehydrogenase electron transfer subunit [Thermoanaerobaculia bacterium]